MSSIVFENVSKRFVLHHEKARSLQDLVVKTVRRRNGNGGHEEFYALRDVSFEIPAGQMVGFIGPNGAGKSTLLKLIARILEPTRGRITVDGRINALIELSAGFHEELTGRENIFLSAALLGMSRRDIQKRFDEIIAFSGLEKFIDTQVKHYSSGMHVRLGFAIATCIESEILLVDEVLAVGDSDFRSKSFERIAEIRARGTTIIFVTHQLAEVERSCDRAILLLNGQVAADGAPLDVIRRYEEEKPARTSSQWSRFRADYLDWVIPEGIRIGERAVVSARVRNSSDWTWSAADGSGGRLVSLGYRWEDGTGRPRQMPLPRSLVPHDVAPGETISLQVPAVPPSEPGRYTLYLDLMAEGVGWFSWGGCIGPRGPVEVRPNSPD